MFLYPPGDVANRRTRKIGCSLRVWIGRLLNLIRMLELSYVDSTLMSVCTVPPLLELALTNRLQEIQQGVLLLKRQRRLPLPPHQPGQSIPNRWYHMARSV